MKVRTNNAGTPILYALVFGLGMGVSTGVIRSAHLSTTYSIVAFIVIGIIGYLLFNRGRASSWSSAQAWAQAQVDVAVEVTQIAQSEAKALSMAYSAAIASAQATAQNHTVIQLEGKNTPDLLSNHLGMEYLSSTTDKAITADNWLSEANIRNLEDIRAEIMAKRGESVDARSDGESPELAMGELNP